jgi:hypothetical protein
MSLITKKTIADVNARRMLLFAAPKVGKTTAVSGLKNCLIIDIEDGTNFIANGDVINVLSEAAKRLNCNPKEVLNHPDGPKECLNIFINIHEELSKLTTKYDYIVIDSVTQLIKIASYYATELYKKLPLGKNFAGKDVVSELPNGAGYDYLRQAYEKILNILEPHAQKCAIEIGHVKDSSIQKNNADISARDINLPGKLKLITCANADAIGFLSRKNKNETWLSFKTDERDLVTGARPPHLSNQEFLIIKEETEGKRDFVYGWDKIFI